MTVTYHAETENSAINVVDFGPFLNGSDKHGVAEALVKSFRSTGFVYLMNHPMPQEKINAMFELAKRFFALPEEIKLLAPHPKSGTHHRGYSPIAMEKVSQHIYDKTALEAHRAKAPDVKESFESGRENDEVMPNIWLPEGVLPGFKEACLEFFWDCYELQKSVLKAIALGLSLSEDYFLPFHTAPDNQLRLLHYPSISAKDIQTDVATRIGAHSDFGTLTFLFQDSVGGLEVEDPNDRGRFNPVPPVAGSVVVNAGDFMMRWSNDTIKSSIHRVRAPQTIGSGGIIPDRYSIPYFCCADLSTVVDCFPGTWSDERPKRYEPISAKEYVMKRLEALYKRNLTTFGTFGTQNEDSTID